MQHVRQVKHVYHFAEGTALTLAGCNHRVWLGGVKANPTEHPCNQAPCYRPERAMGNDH